MANHSISDRSQPEDARRKRFKLGPGIIIAASFIGPGTVTTATVTGASYGYALIWAVAFSIFATIVLQEMAARLGIVTKDGLGDAFRSSFQNPVARFLVIILVICAIGIGGGSYAGGDTTGTAFALSELTHLPRWLLVLMVGGIIAFLLGTGSYKRIETVFTFLVAVMGVIFIVTAIIVQPDPRALLGGFIPTVPTGAALITVGLIGTTVVPYNLFLHASLVQEKWHGVEIPIATREARKDTIVSILIGGIITIAVVITSAATLFVAGKDATSLNALASQLEPTLGAASPYVFATGLFAAGLTSALAGPLGAAYAICSTLGWSTDLKDAKFRAIWSTVLLIGVIIALTGTNPTSIIIIAQATNGILLPIVAAFFLVIMNQKRSLGEYRNGIASNIMGGIVLLIVSGLALYQLAGVFGLLAK